MTPPIHLPPDLTASEIDEICAGLTQNAAKIRFLRRLGLTVERRPNGKPLVNRAHYNAVRGGGGPKLEGPRWRVPV